MMPALRTRKSIPDGAISFATRAARYTDFSSSNSIATHVPDPIVFVVFAHLSKVRAVVMTVHPASANPSAAINPAGPPPITAHEFETLKMSFQVWVSNVIHSNPSVPCPCGLSGRGHQHGFPERCPPRLGEHGSGVMRA